MPIDVATQSEDQLKNLIANHRKKGATESSLYVEALRELERRRGQGLDFDKSFKIIVQTAKQRTFLSYKDLADASGADWSKVHYSVGNHLWNLVEYAHRKGWPMLSAIVVNKPNLQTGKMEPDTLRGFVTAARALGHSVIDEDAFLRQQQQRVFDWASSQQS